MISKKKSYAMKMLQLALALSLLQLDPDNYFNRGWDSQLELNDGDGWELEMLRAVPMYPEYPYANRKNMLPLIDDLIRFDRQDTNNYNVTAYLLNIHDGQNNQTGTTATATTIQEVVEPPGAVALEQSSVMANINPDSTVSSNSISPEFDFFFQSEIVQDQLSVWEQNIADLNDFGDQVPLPSSNVYSGLPLKDDNIILDFHIKTEDKDQFQNQLEGASALNDTFPNRTTSDNIQLEKKNNSESEVPIIFKFKSEESTSAREDDCNPFLTGPDLTDEESEIVEVLWKQDVDLGYSLTPPILSNHPTDVERSKASDDEIEKLKALEELKRDETDDVTENIDDEWAGIPFTIDNETGEYIRLPLDELLNDVLQLAEFTAERNEPNDSIDDSIASTSQAANNKSKFQSLEVNRSDTRTTLNSIETGLSTEDDLPQSEIEVSSLPSPLFDLDDEAKVDLADLDMMIQSSALPFHNRSFQNYNPVGGTNSAFRQSTGFHHSHHQGRVPTLNRGVSMEQRLQDIANLFNPIPGMAVGVGEMPPYPHYPTHYSYQGGGAAIPSSQQSQYPHHHHHHHHHIMHNASLGDICPTQPHYGHNLGSAVSSSMHLTNSNHETDVVNSNSSYKLEHEMMYYPNASSDLNHTTEGFINSILNDEDLHLMDMNVTDNYCTINSTSNNSSVLGSTSGLSSSGGGVGSGHGSGGASTSGSLLPLTISSGHSMLSVGGGTIPVRGLGGRMTSDMLNAGGTDRLDASSDSAVSSMGSERVPSLSDGEWGEGSDSAQDYHQGKYGGPHDYSYSNRLNDGSRQQPQKKHHMFGKRYVQEPLALPSSSASHLRSEPAIKYEYESYVNPTASAGPITQSNSGAHHSNTIDVNNDGAVGGAPIVSKEELQHHTMLNAVDIKYGAYSMDYSHRLPQTSHDIINHNHTYTLPPGTGLNPRPQQRDKKPRKNSEDEHLTRDEKRARAMSVPISVADIINLPMDEFNERLSKYDLTENQLSLIRDIRRRGKNKVAAQNCRKRKLDQILSLEDEVKEVRCRKEHLCRERNMLDNEKKRMANKFATLHRHIFEYLRAPDGSLCSPLDYSLQQAADGSIYLLPRDIRKPENGANINSNNVNINMQQATHNRHNLLNQRHHQDHHNHNQQQHQQQQQQQQHLIVSTGGSAATAHSQSLLPHSQQSSTTHQQTQQQQHQSHQHPQNND